METGYITAVTLTEFMAWYHSGEIRLPRCRLIPVSLNEDGKPDNTPLSKQQLMDHLPYVDIEDEHSVLIVTLSNISKSSSAIYQLDVEPSLLSLDITCIPASRILTISPLTQRGRS